MNATVMCEKCGKPLGVFDGALCYDCEKAGQEPKSIIREAIEDYVCNYLTDTSKAQKILNALQNMEQEPVLEKIRAEIEQDMLFYEEDNCNDKDTGFVMGLQHTLDIIDSYTK